MSIESPTGILDIRNATLKVSKLEVTSATGFDTALNNIARNTILLVDATEQTSSNSWSLKLPNAWLGEFEGYWSSGASGNIDFNFYNNITSGTNGYTLSMDDTTIVVKYDGTTLQTTTLSSTLKTSAYRKVHILFERDTISVSIDGKNELNFKDSSLRARVYDDEAGGYITVTGLDSTNRKFKNLKIVNEKLISDGTSNIAYMGGNLGVGVASPAQTLEVAGTMRFSNVSNSSVFSDMYALPVTVGEYWDAGLKLVADGATAGGLLGNDVDISGDGNTAIVGAYYNDDTVADSGSAYIFVWNGSTWTQQAELVHPDPVAIDFFGWSVSISSDGNTAIVGACYDDVTLTDQGSAYVFTRTNGNWDSGVELLHPNPTAEDNFGISVSISSDGNTALVGARYHDGITYTNQGSAYVFTRSNGTWNSGVELLASDPNTNDVFGFSVSISGDGNTALVGAYGDDDNGSASGSAYVFTYSNGSWSQQPKLVASDGGGSDQFGYNVSISGDGNTALVGARLDDDTVDGSGSAYVFVWNGSTWIQEAKLVASDPGLNAQFGRTVSLSSDGNTAIVGAYQGSDTQENQGSAYIFTRSDGTWVQTRKIVAPDRGLGDNFGNAVSLSGDGTRALVGAYLNDDAGTDSGSAYIFNLVPPSNVNALSISSSVGIGTVPRTQLEVAGTTRFSNAGAFSDVYALPATGEYTERAKLVASDAAYGDYFGWGVSISDDGNTAIVGGHGNDDNGTTSGSVYIFTRSGGTWDQGVKLLASDGAQGDEFGWIVAISGDGNTAVVGSYVNDDTIGNSGSAYVFIRSFYGVWTQQAILVHPTPAASDKFSIGLSISRDGNTVLVGVPYDDDTATDSGSALVFTRDRDTWTKQTTLVHPTPAASDELGHGVAISGDGNTAIVGVRYDDDTAPESGSAYVFTYVNESWTAGVRLVASDPAQADYFGQDVAISGDGNTAIVGSPRDDDTVENQGAAYIFTRSNGTWDQEIKLVAPDAEQGDLFGQRVSISSDGNTALVGGHLTDDGGSNTGSVYIFKKTGSSWNLTQKIVASDLAVNEVQANQFGLHMSISGDGNTALVGAHWANSGLVEGGAAYIFETPGNTLQVSTPIGAKGTVLSFTGQHMCFPDGPMSQGLVVSANKNKYMNLNGPLTTGLGAIKSSESLPVVTLSNVSNDRSVFGVVDRLEYGGTVRNQTTGITIVNATKELGDNRVIVNSIGEGAMWVANTNGNLVSGDYITTSNIAGYGQKQDTDSLKNYTVAKITMDCDFNPEDLPVQVIKKDAEGKNVLDAYGRLQWEDTDRTQKAYSIRYLTTDGTRTDQANAVWTAAYVGCTYHCG